MNKTVDDFHRIADDLFSRSELATSKLGAKFASQPPFRDWAVATVHDLIDYYFDLTPINPDALPRFMQKVSSWLKNPPDAFIGFVGELVIAKKLSRAGIVHTFVPESESPSPDFEGELNGQTFYVEVATLERNPREVFESEVTSRLKSRLPQFDVAVLIDESEVKLEGIDALVDKALDIVASSPLAESRNLIEYSDKKLGSFKILLTKVSRQGYSVSFSWPEARTRSDGTPWLQAKLLDTLIEKLPQFYNPLTILAWVSNDMLLDAVEQHVSATLSQFGPSNPINVAGVLVETPACRKFVNNISYQNASVTQKQYGLLVNELKKRLDSPA